jgi:hypothetical protein
MAKVYMVSRGSYSDYRILGIYSTQEKADRALEVYAADEIEEVELDAIPETPPGMLAWWVDMTEAGDIKQGPHRRDPLDDVHTSWRMALGYADVPPRAFFDVWARDADHAAKVAADKRKELMATGEWQKAFAEETARWRKQ